MEDPASHPTQPQPEPIQKPPRTIQPTAAFTEEMKTVAESPPTAPVTPVVPSSSPQPATPPVTPSFDPASIYPTVADHQPPSLGVNKPEAEEVTILTYNEGWVMGSTIYWSQLAFGFAASIVIWILELVLAKAGSHIVILLFGLVLLAVGIIEGIWIPYRTLKSSSTLLPGWITALGISMQSILSLTIFFLLDVVLVRLILFHKVSAKIAQNSGAIVLFTYAAVIVGSVILGYYISKLSYALAFKFAGKLVDNTKIKAAAIVAVILALFISTGYGVLTRYELRSAVSSSLGSAGNVTAKSAPAQPKADPVPPEYKTINLAAHSYKLSLSFDPQASVVYSYTPARTLGTATQPDNIPAEDTVRISGKQLNSENIIRLTVNYIGSQKDLGTINPKVCKSASDTSTANHGTILLFNATIMGQQFAMCQAASYMSGADVYFEANSTWYSLQYYGTSDITTADLPFIQSIVSSVQIH